MKRLLGVVALVVLAACSVSEGGEVQELTGLITEIEGNVLTFETTDGRVLEMEIADTTVPLEHLYAHMKDRVPTTIIPDPVGDRLLARRIGDAPTGTTVPGTVPFAPPP